METKTRNTVRDIKMPTQIPKRQQSAPRIDKDDTRMQSPFKYISQLLQTEGINSQIENYLNKISSIYIHYTSYGDKLNIFTLKAVKFHRLLSDAGIECESNKREFDLIYYSVCKGKCMTIKEFINCLIKIAKIYSPKSTIKQAMELLLHQIIQLYESIKKAMASACSQNMIEYQVKITESTLRCIEKPLFNIFKVYFPFVFTGSPVYQHLYSLSLCASFKLLSDFDLYPSTISKPTAFYIFQSVIDKEGIEYPTHQKDNGKIFTFHKFIEFIVRASVAIWSKGPNINHEGIMLIKSAYRIL